MNKNELILRLSTLQNQRELIDKAIEDTKKQIDELTAEENFKYTQDINDEDRVCCSELVMRNVIKREIYPYLHKEFHKCNVPKYYHLFDEWYKNLTATQVAYQQAYSQGRKTILNEQ